MEGASRGDMCGFFYFYFFLRMEMSWVCANVARKDLVLKKWLNRPVISVVNECPY